MEYSAVDLSEIQRQAQAIERCLSIAERLRDEGGCATLADEAERAFVIGELLTVAAHAHQMVRDIVTSAVNGEVEAESFQAYVRKIDRLEISRCLETASKLQLEHNAETIQNVDMLDFIFAHLCMSAKIRCVSINRCFFLSIRICFPVGELTLTIALVAYIIPFLY